MLSSRSDFAARICPHITLSTASRSQTLTRAQPQRSSAGRAAAISAVRIQIQAPAARSPPGVFGKKGGGTAVPAVR